MVRRATSIGFAIVGPRTTGTARTGRPEHAISIEAAAICAGPRSDGLRAIGATTEVTATVTTVTAAVPTTIRRWVTT